MISIHYRFESSDLWRDIKQVPTRNVSQIFSNVKDFDLKNPIAALVMTIMLAHIAVIASSWIALGLTLLVAAPIVTQGRAFVSAAIHKLTSGAIIGNDDLVAFEEMSLKNDYYTIKNKFRSLLSKLNIFSFFKNNKDENQNSADAATNVQVLEEVVVDNDSNPDEKHIPIDDEIQTPAVDDSGKQIYPKLEEPVTAQ